MPEPTDEVLMAYADGLLDENEMRALERQLETDPVLQARLEPFIVTGKPIARLFERTLSTDIPDRLVDTIFASQSSAARVPAAKRPAWSGIADAIRSGMMVRLAGPAFAGLAIGVLSGWLIRGELSNLVAPAGALLAATPRGTLAVGQLASALDSLSSGKTVAAHNSEGRTTSIKVDLSFLTEGDTVCRQYRLDTDGQVFGGVACKAGSDGWRVEVHAPTATKLAGAPDGQVRPATGGKDPLPAAVSGAVDKMITSDPLTVQQEEGLMKNGWVKAR